MKDIFESYLHSLREDRADKKELSDRSELEKLLKAAANNVDAAIHVIHEAKATAGQGCPDFKVTKSGMILGYVENKAVGVNLDEVLKSEQIVRYKQLSGNILLTDYLQFIWLKDGRVNGRELIAFPHDLEGKPKRPRQDRVNAVTGLLRGFFSSAPEGIARAEQLALALATRSHFLRDFLDSELRRQEKEHRQARLYGLYEIFRDQVFHELALAEFADAFAQMLAYGLFLSRLNSGAKEITLANAKQFVPGSFRLIRELVQFLDDLDAPEYAEIRWVVEEILSIVNGLDLAAIHEDLSFRHRKTISHRVRAKDEEERRLFERDPFIYFYEDFLGKYDAQMKKSRGVYYTPPPIVNFIVRAVDDILKDTFGIEDGLADHKRVTVLDFACGTGTFLLEVFQRIFDNVGGADSGKASLIVRDHMLKNVFGFEYLIAPYTIAHLKLSQYLADQGHQLTAGERLQVFLTNTLEPIEPQKNFLMPAVSAEVAAAQAVKEQPILIITGNPPYSGHSKNKGPWITTAIDEYKFTWEKTANGLDERRPLGEKNPKWLQDDYVKFIRFAQMKMDGFTFKTKAPDGKPLEHSVAGVERGVVGIITNHSWLDNPTFRGMRQSLMRSFEQIYVLDLHGSSKPKELAPSDAENENVFDIQKGVAITLLVKNPKLPRAIWFAEFWGNRLDKYRACAEAAFDCVDWRPVRCIAPYYMCRPLDWTGWDEYEKGWPVADALDADANKRQIFEVNVLGFQTHRDHFAVAFEKSEIERRVRDMVDPAVSDRTIRERYNINDNRDWKLREARQALRARSKQDLVGSIVQCAYRPFDDRSCYFRTEFMDYPRRELIDNVTGRTNSVLLISRQIGVRDWRHVMVTALPANDCVVSDGSSEANYCFPIWTYDSTSARNENFTATFRAFIDARYGHHYEPEEILGYIYAILHTATYRIRYAEFLRIDFPRIPFPKPAADFETLSNLGWTLVQAHLLRQVPMRKLAKYHGKGAHEVEFVRYSAADQAVAINDAQRFAPAPPAVWDFCIGGYQVLDKYLKSRKGRKLTLDEINHIASVADALAFTLDQMAKIDEAYLAAFP